MKRPQRLRRLSIGIFHPYPLVRAGIRSMLIAPDVRVVYEAATPADALRFARSMAPRILLMGCHPLSQDECAELLERMKTLSPTVAVLLLTGSNRPSDMVRALRLGCSGYLSPSVTRKDLLKTVRAIAAGDCVVDPARLRNVLQGMTGQQPTARNGPRTTLTPMELEILRLLTEGLTNREIANRRTKSIATIKAYVQRIIQKLHVSDRTQAAVTAIRTGLVT